jgi:excisionase family DNA binding protein
LPPSQPVQTGSQSMAQAAGRDAVDDRQTIQIALSPEECKIIREDATFKQLLGRIIGEPSVEVGMDSQGQIIFNVHIKQVYGTRMLSPDNVCEMLQVSKGLLGRLVREEKIRSYRVGRLRRFMLEDVIEYLTGMAVGAGSEAKSSNAGGDREEPR